MKTYGSRAIMLANYILTTGCTIRDAAKIFALSKSTVHNDVSNKLKKIDFSLYKKVNKILRKNFEEKHIRGGEATRKKYKNI